MTHHPCGSLPVDTFTLNVWWCDHHQAFWASASTWRESSGEPPDVLDQARIEFGPFDDLVTVQAWVREQWDTFRILGASRP